jgi:hypothetical protein
MARKDKEREERLAAALRENLRKRKAQSRIMGAPSGVAVAERLLTERALDSTGDRVTDPDDDAEQKDGENEL